MMRIIVRWRTSLGILICQSVRLTGNLASFDVLFQNENSTHIFAIY